MFISFDVLSPYCNEICPKKSLIKYRAYTYLVICHGLSHISTLKPAIFYETKINNTYTTHLVYLWTNHYNFSHTLTLSLTSVYIIHEIQYKNTIRTDFDNLRSSFKITIQFLYI